MIALLFFFNSAFAATLESHFLAEMAHAKSPAAIERIHADYAQLKIAQTACQIQLRSHVVPAACYEALALELKCKIRKSGEADVMLRKLDAACAQASEKLRINVDANPSLSKSCAQNLAQARAIKEYREEWSEN